MGRLSTILVILFLTSYLVTSLDSRLDENPTKKPRKPNKKKVRRKAEEATQKGDYKKATAWYTRLIKLEPSQLNYYKRSEIYARRRQWDKAISDCTEAIKKDIKFVKAYIMRAKLSTRSGLCKEAVDDFEMALKIKPNHKKVTEKISDARDCSMEMLLGRQLFEMSQWKQAVEHLTKALKVAYDSIPIMMMITRCHLYLEDYQSTIIDTMRILKIDKSNLDAILLRGEAYHLMGDDEIALKHFKEGLKLDPEHKEMKKRFKHMKKYDRLNKQCDSAISAGDFTEALEIITKALEVDPHHRLYQIQQFLKQCNTYMKLKNATSAIRSCSKVIDIQRDNIDAWMKRGEARIMAEEYQEAIRDYQEAVNIDGNNRDAQEGLRNAKLELKKSERVNYYKILGVSKDAPQSEIKKMFRKLALEQHPDKHKGKIAKEEAEKKFKELSSAYEILSNPDKRKKYDNGEDIQTGGHPGGQTFTFNGQTFTFQFN